MTCQWLSSVQSTDHKGFWSQLPEGTNSFISAMQLHLWIKLGSVSKLRRMLPLANSVFIAHFWA